MEDLTYPEEYKQCMNYSLTILKVAGVYFEKNASFCKKYWRLVCHSLLLAFNFVMFTIYINNAKNEQKNLFKESKFIAIWSITAQVLLKSIMVIKNIEKIREIIEQLGFNWRVAGLSEKQQKMMSDYRNQLQYRQKVTTYLHSSAVCLYWGTPLLLTLFKKYVLQQKSVWLHPWDNLYPLAVTDWTSYLVLYAIQIYSIIILSCIYLGVDYLIILLSSNLTNEFMLLQQDLIEIRPKKHKMSNVDDDLIACGEEKTLRDFVKRHQIMLALTQLLDASFKEIATINWLFAVVNTCFFSFAARTSSRVAESLDHYMADVVIFTTTFSLCYSSEMLCRSSLGIAECAYQSRWYEADKSYRSSIYLIIMRSQNGCSLTALNNAPISLNSFAQLLSTTWTYMSVANSFYDKHN